MINLLVLKTPHSAAVKHSQQAGKLPHLPGIFVQWVISVETAIL
jgi:hypothetical protein